MIGVPASNTSDAGLGSGQLWIACLCAAWCGSCRDWQPLLKHWALNQPGTHVMWVDIEDEADWLDDLGLDIETFPTLLLARRDRALFLGPVVPQVASVTRLLAGLTGTTPASTALSEGAQQLASQLWLRQQAHTSLRLG